MGGGTGPAAGTSATTCTPGPWHIDRMLQAIEGLPVNFGLFGKGNASQPAALVEQIRAGVVALKLHEDWGTTPQAIDTCLTVAEDMDIAVAIHTDTLNEFGLRRGYHRRLQGPQHPRLPYRRRRRRPCAGYHQGVRPGQRPAQLDQSDAPFTVNTVDEHLDMLMVCHHLDPRIPEDVAFAESRIRRETIAAEDILHDIGAFSMISSDSQAMGRVGEVIIRTWQTADKMKRQRGALGEEQGDNDNFRVKRYIAKYTINPALTHGVADQIGSIAVGKLADLVIWTPAFFGVKPDHDPEMRDHSRQP